MRLRKPGRTSISTQVPAGVSKQTALALARKRLQGKWDASTVLALMEEIESWDQQVENEKIRAQSLMGRGVVGAFLCFLAAGICLVFLPRWDVAIAGLLLLAGACWLAYWGGRRLRHWKSVDVPDEIRLSLLPALRQLRQDLHPRKKIRIRLSLNTFDENRCRSSRNLPRGSARSIKLELFDEPVGRLRLPLANGATVILCINNSYQKRTRHYTSSSGRSKVKYKWTKRTYVTCVLIPETANVQWDRSGTGNGTAQPEDRLTFTQRKGVTAAKLDRQFKFKEADHPPQCFVAPAQILRMLVRLQVLRGNNPRSPGV